MVNYIQGLFSIANFAIASFIAIYAYLFLMKTQHHKERRPWEFLFISSILFLFFEIISLLVYFGLLQIVGVDALVLSKIFEFLYSGFVLLAFISQHDLILESHLILISKKETAGSVELNVKGIKKKAK